MLLRLIRGIVSAIWSLIKLITIIIILAKIVMYVLSRRGDDTEQEVPVS